MKTFAKIALSIVIPVLGNAAHADNLTPQDPKSPTIQLPQTTITATRVETARQNVGRSVEVRDDHELTDRQTTTLSQATQTVSGIWMPTIGGPGAPGTTPVEIRGFRTGGTQLLLNGFKLSDPSSVSGTYEQFFSYLTLDDVERIEVLKGGTGVLYGSDGQGGAIELFLKQPQEGISGEVSMEGGSFSTVHEYVSANVGNTSNAIRGTVSRTDSDGIDEHGDYENSTVSLIATSQINDQLKLTPILRFIRGENRIDSDPTIDSFGNLVLAQDTEKNSTDGESLVAGVTTEYTPSIRSTSKASLYFSRADRGFFFDFDGFESSSRFRGKSVNLDLENTLNIESLASLVTTGIQFEHQRAESRGADLNDASSRDQYSIFVHDQTALIEDIWNVSGGFRLTGISNIDQYVPTLELASSLAVPGTSSRLHSSLAQGFRAPTLFESDGKIVDFETGEVVSVGNDNLREEDSLSFDFGVEQTLVADALIADITYFQTESDETIVYDFLNNTHVNGGSGKTRGLEGSLAVVIQPWARLRAAYTNLDQAQELSGQRRQRTPRNWYSLSGQVEIGAVTVAPTLRYRDKQEVAVYGFADRATEKGATVFDLATTWNLSDSVALFVRGENIFDVEYSEAGFRMPRASVFSGIRIKLGA